MEVDDAIVEQDEPELPGEKPFKLLKDGNGTTFFWDGRVLLHVILFQGISVSTKNAETGALGIVRFSNRTTMKRLRREMDQLITS
jgi:hypothetical protein